MELKFKKLKLKYISVFCLVGNYFSFLLIRSNFLFEFYLSQDNL